MKYIIIGAGSRGMTYGRWAKANGIEIAAIAEIRPDRLDSAGEELNVPREMRFSTPEPLFRLGKIADAAIIATMDRDHFSHVMQALDCGYDILLEKPISPVAEECLAIEEKAKLIKDLKFKSWVKLIYEIILFAALLCASKIFADHGIYGLSQVATMGMLGYTSTLISFEIDLLKSFRILKQ